MEPCMERKSSRGSFFHFWIFDRTWFFFWNSLMWPAHVCLYGLRMAHGKAEPLIGRLPFGAAQDPGWGIGMPQHRKSDVHTSSLDITENMDINDYRVGFTMFEQNVAFLQMVC